MEKVTVQRNRRNRSLKKKEEPPLYKNSDLKKRFLQRLQINSQKPSTHSSLTASPELKLRKVQFTPSPSANQSPEVRISEDSPEHLYLNESNRLHSARAHSALVSNPLRPILKKSDFELQMFAIPRANFSASPSKASDLSCKRQTHLNSVHVEALDKMMSNLSPVGITELRHLIAKCRVKTRQFYQEMSRQASMTDEEIREEIEHRGYLQNLMQKRKKHKARSMQRVSRSFIKQ